MGNFHNVKQWILSGDGGLSRLAFVSIRGLNIVSFVLEKSKNLPDECALHSTNHSGLHMVRGIVLNELVTLVRGEMLWMSNCPNNSVFENALLW